MAIGHALTLAAAILLPPVRCEFIVHGTHEPTSEFTRLLNLYRDRPLSIAELERLGEEEPKSFLRRFREVREMIQNHPDEALLPDDACLRAASLMETELGMALAQRSQWDKADFHFDTAWTISTLLQSPALRLRFQRDWLLTSGLFHHELIFVSVPGEAFWRADRFLHEAVKRYPEDAEILLAAGALLEWSGSLAGGDRGNLKEAEDLYSRVLAITPSDPEALLRHGSVLEKRDRAAEAEGPLRRLLEQGGEPNLLYRCRMVLGRLAEKDGRLEEAIEHYQRASGSIPSWQVASIARGHVLHLSGLHDQAREVLESGFALEASEEAFVGWWSYGLGLAPRWKALLARMLEAVRR
jgi:tetratricopeptide (TPR) repeat protein